MCDPIQLQANSTTDRLWEFDKNILSKASISIPTFGGRRFLVDGKQLSYNDLLKDFAKLIPANASKEEKVLGNNVFKHLKQLDENATSTLKKQNVIRKIFTSIRSFFGNLTTNRRGTISDIEKKLQLSAGDIPSPSGNEPQQKVDSNDQKLDQLGYPKNKISKEFLKKLNLPNELHSVQQEQLKKEVGIDFPELVDALGGHEAVRNLPVLMHDKTKHADDFMDFLEPSDLSAPIMRGFKPNGAPFVAFRFVKVSGDKETELCETWTLKSQGKNVYPSGRGNQIAMNVNSFAGGEEDSKVALDRLKRLFKDELVGLMKDRKTADNKIEYYEETPILGKAEIKLWQPPKV
jgi:hypothetical protein